MQDGCLGWRIAMLLFFSWSHFFCCSHVRRDWLTARMTPVVIFFPTLPTGFFCKGFPCRFPAGLQGKHTRGECWGAGGRHSTRLQPQAPSFSSAKEMLYAPPLLIAIGTTRAQVWEDVPISSQLGNVASVSDWAVLSPYRFALFSGHNEV